MPIYECDKCHIVFNYKKEYDRHINKQKKCTENVIYECEKCHNIYKYKSDYDRHINKKNPCKIINNKNTLININEEISIIKCNECHKEFTTMRSLKRHQKEYCNKLDFIEKNDLIKMVKELEKQINNKDININNNKDNEKIIIDNSHNSHNANNSYNTLNNSGNTTNIIINAYGKEDLSHITEKDYKTLFRKCNSLIPALIELIHFNENKPENKNVFMSNIKSKYVNVYDGKQWNLMNKYELIDDIYDNKCIIIIDKFDDMKKEILNKTTIELFSKFIDKHETKMMKKNMADKIQLLLYNNRNLIQK